MTSTRTAAGMPSRFEAAASFVRLSALGVTVFFAVLGAASGSAGLALAPRPLIAIVLAAVAFHVYAYVFNDVVDLPIDRTAPARWPSPLVRGTVRPGKALTVALAQIPVAAGLAWWGGAGLAGVLALLAACGLMAVYNLWGKHAPFPPLTDLVQGLGWAALTFFGAAVAGGPGPATGGILAFVTVYIVMANGVHGSIRDLRNDLRYGVRSTAILLGARPGGGRAILLPRRLSGYALALQAVLTGIVVAVPLGLLGHGRGARSGAWPAALALVAILAVGCFALLGVALRCARDERLLWSAGTQHLVATMALPIVFLVGQLPGWMVAALLAGYLLPFFFNGWLKEALRWAWWRRSSAPRAHRPDELR
jgi:4-hydroxybenzoate polyprenyltransferase